MNYEIIKKYCDDKRISLPELAKKVGLSKTGLYLAISKKTLTVEKLEAIVKELDVPIWYFFDLDPEAPYIKDIEQQKNRNKINETTLAQMGKVIEELKKRLDNIKTVTTMFIMSRELVVYGRIHKQKYEPLINTLLDFLESKHDDQANEKFMRAIGSIMNSADNDASDVVIGKSKSQKAKSVRR